MTPHTQPPTMPTQPAPHLHPVEVRTTRRDRVVSVLLALVNVAAFAMMLLVALIWGPEQFMGEYDRAAGHQAVIGLVLILVAVAAWAFFFATYARAGRANVLGFVVMGAAAAVDVVLIVQKLRSLNSGRADSGLPSSDVVPWQHYAIVLGWASLAVLSAVAIRHPRFRWAAVVPLAAAGFFGLVWIVPLLAAGGADVLWMLTVAAPVLAPFLLLAAVFSGTPRAASH